MSAQIAFISALCDERLNARGHFLIQRIGDRKACDQRTRLANAERILETKATKAATESKRIASEKIDAAMRRIADLKRTSLKDADSRIYPGWYAPVMIVQDGHRVVVPMRYRCRLPGWTEEMEKEKPGTYNARRNNLQRVWGKLFGHNHGIMIVNRFYEHVDRNGGKTGFAIRSDAGAANARRLPVVTHADTG
jgi:hypothetical protein